MEEWSVGSITTLRSGSSEVLETSCRVKLYIFPLSVMRFRLELMPALAGWTKQKLPTTSTTQNSLSPVAASMIFSEDGTSISVVYLSLARIGTMSCEWYCTVRAEASCATATEEPKIRATPVTRNDERFM